MSTSTETSSLYEAVKSWNWDLIDKCIKKGSDINASLITTGPQAGYTALHLACIEEEEYEVLRLVTIYKAHVNVVGDDGAQPIHIACLRGKVDALWCLILAGANVNAEIEQDIYEKYVKDKAWSDDFGGKMTLSTFAILYSNIDSNLRWCLLQLKANCKIKSTNNKTLLMYAVEKDDYSTVAHILSDYENHPEFMDARDNDGLHAVHYLLPNKIFGDFRYDQKLSFLKEKKKILETLMEVGANVYATVNGDPDTLLLNMVVYRCCYYMLPILLKLDYSISKSKALYYATLPVENPNKFIRTYDIFPSKFHLMEDIQIKRKRIIRYIIQDLILRHTLGLFIPEKEKELMNKLIAEEAYIRSVAHDFDNNVIEKVLKNKVIHYRDKSMTLHEFSMKTLNDRTLKLLVKNDNLVEAFRNSFQEIRYHNKDTHGLIFLLCDKIDRAFNRRKLLEKVKRISHLREAIPLPYEIVLLIIEFLDNTNLRKFIDAFYD